MTSRDHEPPRERGWLPWVVSLVGVGVAVGALVVLVMTLSVSTPTPTPGPVNDRAGLSLVRQRLSAAVGDVNAVADPANSRATGGARITGCPVDSGEVFEPALYREWELRGAARGVDILHTTEPGRTVASDVAKTLIARGWAGSAALDQDAATFLTKRFNGHEIHLSVQATGESVLVSGNIQHRRVCHSQV